MERAAKELVRLHDEFAAHDQSDYSGLGTLQSRERELQEQHSELETRWLELSERLEP